MAKARTTQRLANTFPPWSQIRSNDQSVGQQFLNAFGLNLDELHKQLERGKSGWWLPTTPTSEVDLFYQYKLPKTFSFVEENDNDVTEFRYETPTVSGYVGAQPYAVTLAEDNSIENFWYKAVPSRLSLLESTDALYVVASGFVTNSPLYSLLPSGMIRVPNRLGIKMVGGISYLNYEEGILRRGLVQVEGETRQGLPITENLLYLYDETRYTVNDFSTVSGIYVSGVDPEETTAVYLTAAEFQNPPYRHVYNHDFAETGEQVPSFWVVESGSSPGRTKLGLQYYENPEVDIRIAGFVDLYTAISQEFINTAGDPINVVDIAPESFSDWLWAVDQSALYLYRSDLPYVNCQDLEFKTPGCASQLEISDEYIVPDDSITVAYIWRRPTRSILRHRVWVVDPAGDKWAIEDGILTPFTATLDFWVYNGELRDRHLRKTDTFTLSDPGQYVYGLEVQYSDGVYELDKRIVYVGQITPVAEYNLRDLGIEGDVAGVDVDSEHYLWVINNLGVRYKLDRHYDLMLIDYTNSILYFREGYSQVKVVV